MTTFEPQLVVPTPWYPIPSNRMVGSYVVDHARLAHQVVPHVEVLHAYEWPGGAPRDVAQLRSSFDSVLQRASLRVPGGPVPLTRVPVMITRGTTVPQRAEALVADTRTAVGTISAPLVHGHVGYLGGLLAARLADPASKVFATEHSTGLRDVLADPEGKDQYAEVLDRVDRMFCVSGVLRDQVLEAFPSQSAKVEILHNPVDFDAVPMRESAPTALDRWVFIGGLIERKGVVRLLHAFSAVARTNKKASLTLFGEGQLQAELEAIAVDAGVRDRVTFRGVVPHAVVLEELQTFDLLVAPSTYETFHLAVPEAVAAGVPVIVSRSGGPQEALAGVEDRVGRFVDVEDSPDAIVDACNELSGKLSSLDLPGARADLAARYGPAAIAARLGEAYGPVGAPTPSPVAADAPIDRVLLLAVSANRRYDVEAAFDALESSATDAVLVSQDAELVTRAEAGGVPVVPPSAAGRMAGAPRTLKGKLSRRLKGFPKNPFGLLAEGREVVHVSDCQSAPAALALADKTPGLELICHPPGAGELR